MEKPLIAAETVRKASLSNLHTHEATGSSPVVSTKESPRAAKVLGFLFVHKILGLLVTCK